MSNTIRQVANSLVGHAKTKKTSVKDIKNKTLKDAFKDKLLDQQKGVTQTVFLKSRRLAAIELMQENLQAIIDTKGWTEPVKARFPDATFHIHARKGQIIIEVNV